MIKEFTVSVYILHKERVLLLYHKKIQKWLPPGGHIESNETPIEAARREVREETGLEIEFICQENVWMNYWNASSFPRPYLCLLEEIPAYQELPAHQHMDLIYIAHLLDPLKTEPLSVKGEEIKWFSLEELKELSLDIEIYEETYQVLCHLFQESQKKSFTSTLFHLT